MRPRLLAALLLALVLVAPAGSNLAAGANGVVTDANEAVTNSDAAVTDTDAAVTDTDAAVTDTDAADPRPQVGGLALVQGQPDPDNTITRIDLAADGAATWELTLRTRLETDADLEEYERFQASFRSNTSRYLDPFAERMSGVVARANESYDREMRAGDFTATTTIQEVPRRWGVVTFRFSWTGFAAVDGETVVVGDVFDGGFYIGEDDVLEIAAPDGFVLSETDPAPDGTAEGVAEWRGREDFDDGRPRVVATPASDGAASPAGDGTLGGGGTLAALAGVLVIVALVAAYAVRTGRIAAFGSGDDLAVSAVDRGSAPPDEASADVGSSADGGAATDAAAGSAGTAPPILTDEDRVRRALRERGGRMKQSVVAEELGWSKSKTSRVLSGMADEGTVEKLRIGRENVIDLIEDDD
ncbi:helix-turn-helix transcriptional regulator [Halobellus rarus]|uniref:Helix-turn-helix transcriptional regulator n=1 Tax=Halobellus rarus TaxID=1126237 RepID=A0ABD6CL67_9EURY|nr:helix-turn-helix domain-containing protein [Halobellus rarus]